MKPRKIEINYEEFLTLHYILQHQDLRQKKTYFYLFLFHCLFPLEYVFTYAVGNQRSRLFYNTSARHECDTVQHE